MSKGSTVTMYTKANDTHANNIGAKESWGHKKRENIFANSFVGTGSGGISYVNSKSRATTDQQGQIVNTGTVSDLSIDGQGMLVVTGADGMSKFTRRGDFRQDELGYWQNGAGQSLQAWKLDANGNLPQNSSLLSSLESVNFANTKGLPVATSIISLAMNLNADQGVLRGNGALAQINTTGKNRGIGDTDIILPDNIKGVGNINVGDQITLRSDDSTSQTVKYGGFVSGNRAFASNDGTQFQIFGASSATNTFNFAAPATPPAPGILLSGQKIKITVTNGETYKFTAITGGTSPSQGTFNSIKGLADAINRVVELQAKVDANGRIYIAPTDANKGLTFENAGGGNIIEELGVSNLAPANADEQRFNSKQTLRNAVNSNDTTTFLKATLEAGDINMTALLATSQLNISGQSYGINKINSSTLNPGNDELGRAELFISAPDNNLTTGAFVRITDMNINQTGIPALTSTVPDGIYRVGKSNPNGFTINLIDAAETFPVIGDASVTPGADASWEKVQGRTYSTFNDATIGVAGGAGAVITITLPAHQAATTAENWGNDDVVYISGLGTVTAGASAMEVPDGYYKISNYVDGVAPTFDLAQVSIANAAQPVAGAFSVTKIGNTAGVIGDTNGTFNTQVFFANGPGADRSVRMYQQDHNYSIGDVIRFDEMPEPFEVDGIALTNNTSYMVTGSAQNYLEFKVFDVNGIQLNGAGTDEPALSENAFQTYSAANAAGNQFHVNNFSRLFEYLDIASDDDSLVFDAKYNPELSEKNLSSAINGNSNFASALTYEVPLTIYDSLGSEYTLTLLFAKLDQGKWAIELTASSDSNNNYDILDVIPGTNGLIRSGVMEFDENGVLSGLPEGFEDPILIQRNNQSAQSSITIDWLNTMSKITSGTVTQIKSPNNLEITQSNGQAPGTLTKLEVSPTGDIIATFDSGETRALYKLPIAMFANVNGLVAGSNGTYDISRESGELILKVAGGGGAGLTLGGTLESSNVDVTQELLQVRELSNTIQANARVAATDFENFSKVLSELRG